jgi:hypothetical protein
MIWPSTVAKAVSLQRGIRVAMRYARNTWSRKLNMRAEKLSITRMSGAIFGTRARKVNNALKGYRGKKYREK